jgi:predicted kinase
VNNPKLIIICGLPASGKTTLAQKLERDFRAVRLSADDWMRELGIDLWDQAKRSKIEALQWTLGQQLLVLGQTLIIEWGTWTRSERDTLRTAARALGAAVELHDLSAPVDVLFERIQQRAAEHSRVTRAQIQQWADSFDVPTGEELALYDSPSRVDY